MTALPEDPEKVGKLVQHLQDAMRRRGVSVEDAASEFAALQIESDLIGAAVKRIREEGRRNQMLKVPGGMESLEYRQLTQELIHRRWYTGPSEDDPCWPAFRRSLLQRGLDSRAIKGIDQASTKIVSYLGDPGVRGIRTKGLVIGHVQSGKTSNYMAVIAKAADAGYRLIIVLSGMYNALRQQTQRRLNSQLVDPAPDEMWFPLTREDADFGKVSQGGALLSQPDLRLLVVTKKNVSRLKRLRDWLKHMNRDTRLMCPALLIDDEADQASPNTGDGEEQRSRINSLIVELVGLLPTSSYIGYTATPFANVFIDPSARDLYPSNFIISLERPRGYFGAEAIFGRSPLDDGDNPDDGYDMVRDVPAAEADALRPPRAKEERETFLPSLQASLSEAVRYFLLATAARRARGQVAQHSSMLVHTTQYSGVHLRQRDELRGYVDMLRRQLANGDPALLSELETQWNREMKRVRAAEFGNPTTSFSEIKDHLKSVLKDVRVIADNYISEDRLDYTRTVVRDGEEVPVTQTVIAVGGNTLSRGLTLEGLLVSYFIRSGRAYDTLLQMGRWFGFRPGYEDLPRVWMTVELRRQFRFLATIEEEIRLDVERYERERMTPQDYGVRVRCHPDLMITAPSKMRVAEKVSLSYSGERLQTFLFRHRDRSWLTSNIEATRALVRAARSSGSQLTEPAAGKFVLKQVHYERVVDFLASYQFHPDHARLRPDLLIGYIRNRMDHADGELEWWNVAVMGGPGAERNVEGKIVDLGTINLGLDHEIPLINRAPLGDSSDERADIKALMSKPDRLVDLEDIGSGEAREMGQLELQRSRPSEVGLLLIYPISKNSVPMGVSIKAESRKDLDAVEHVMGVGIVFPESKRALEGNPTYEYDYVAVRLPDDDPELYEVDDVDTGRLDTERDAVIDPVLRGGGHG